MQRSNNASLNPMAAGDVGTPEADPTKGGGSVGFILPESWGTAVRVNTRETRLILYISRNVFYSSVLTRKTTNNRCFVFIGHYLTVDSFFYLREGPYFVYSVFLVFLCWLIYINGTHYPTGVTRRRERSEIEHLSREIIFFYSNRTPVQ